MELTYLRRTAMVYARRFGLCQQDAEDCACSFVLHYLEKQKAEITPCLCTHLTAEYAEAWWQRCARNYVLNYRRSLHRCQQHLSLSYNDSDDFYNQIPSREQNRLPHASYCRREATEQIVSVFALLPGRTRRLFVAHYLEGQSLDSLAQEQGMQANAISQILFRARMRLRQQLEQSGWTRNEFIITFRVHY